MAGHELRNRVAIVGVGNSNVDRDRGTDLLPLVTTAFKHALDDCGLERDAIDGMLLAPTLPDDIGFDRFPIILGLKNIRWTMQTWRHGRLLPDLVMGSAMAIASGFANTIVCAGMGESVIDDERKSRANPQDFEDRKPGYYGAHLEVGAYGATTPHVGAALALRRYHNKYQYAPEALSAVAVAQRQWANLNPGAYYYREPLSVEQYNASPYVVDPLREHDCGLAANVGFCFIMTSAERARDLKNKPIPIAGWQGARYNRDTFILSRPGLGVGFQREFTYEAPEWPVYASAGITRDDVDLLYTLDSFSSLVPFTLEVFGFCKDGEGLAYLQDGRIGPGGALPINTSGGGLSEANSRGYGHVVEAVRQLRGECGDRQVAGAAVAQYANPDGGSFILTRAPV